MNFLNSILGVNKSIDVFTQNLIKLLQLLQPTIGKKEVLIQFLNENNIPFRRSHIDHGSIHWAVEIEGSASHFMMDEDARMITVSFFQLNNSYFDPISILLSNSNITYRINYPYSKSIESLPNESKELITLLAKYKVKNSNKRTTELSILKQDYLNRYYYKEDKILNIP